MSRNLSFQFPQKFLYPFSNDDNNIEEHVACITKSRFLLKISPPQSFLQFGFPPVSQWRSQQRDKRQLTAVLETNLKKKKRNQENSGRPRNARGIRALAEVASRSDGRRFSPMSVLQMNIIMRSFREENAEVLGFIGVHALKQITRNSSRKIEEERRRRETVHQRHTVAAEGRGVGTKTGAMGWVESTEEEKERGERVTFGDREKEEEDEDEEEEEEVVEEEEEEVEEEQGEESEAEEQYYYYIILLSKL
ncbi:hypothetical protein WN51_09550 [Melipona quadrifasciata]|uniref:Uncharacterized protein n=1 Tax=Melipona quadrifasciata TaxID=166423 RepID=A0A0N0BIZ8_9HYME|nr:hypothetical protein WN51_09550 [Melipona quadrifasciata]